MRAPGKWSTLLALAASVLLVKSLWFSASAVVPQLASELGLGGSAQSWITGAVQLGFVFGALTSAFLNVPDRHPLPRLVAAGALAGAVANAAILLGGGSLAWILICRFLTGAALAAVYPPGMKIVATWCKEDRGLGIGLLVAALTFGSALPHLLNALSGPQGMPAWPGVVLATSGLAAVGALVAAVGVRPGPLATTVAPFDWRYAARSLQHQPTRLANIGYLGHMWELYAMWAWMPLLLLASYEAAGWSARGARIAGFSAVAAGALGALLAGVWADRAGRTTVATVSLALSGASCLVAGPLFAWPGWLTVLCLVWGIAVVADSAQFSAAVSELADPRYIGTALTVQTCLGFLLTLLSIRLVPALLEQLGWGRALPVLALGPVAGIVAMLRLRRLPEAVRMASGRR